MNEKYYMIDERDRNTVSELKEYSFEDLKNYFEPSREEFPEEFKKWEAVKDIYDLEDFLKWEAAGMEQPYRFERVSVNN